MTYVGIPAAPAILTTSFSGGLPGDRAQATLTCNRTGYWAAFVNINLGSQGSQYDVLIRMQWGSSNAAGQPTLGAQGLTRVPANATSQCGWSLGYDGSAVLLSNGQMITFRTNSTSNAGVNGDFWIVFVPTTAYPK